MAHPIINVADNLESLADSAAAHAAEFIRQAPSGRPFLLALSGGPEVKPFHRKLAEEFRDEIPWERVVIFWGDDRYVPPDHEDSNYLLARKTLLDHVPIPEHNIVRMRTEAETPEDTAREYEDLLREHLSNEHGFDLMIMGLGDDGHTASLFPEHEALKATDRWVLPVEAPEHEQPRTRITCTLPLINRSRHIIFLVSGEEKHEKLRLVLDPETKPQDQLPASLVKPPEPVHWFVDEAAYAGALSS
jgi:6-phosphogluconolactonase